MMWAAEILSACEYLYCAGIYQENDGCLVLKLEEHRLGEVCETGNDIVKFATSIEMTKDCRSFTLTWQDYAAFTVTEDAQIPIDEEKHKSCYSEDVNGNFLTYLKTTKNFCNLSDGHLGSWRIVTLNRYIEVVSFSPVIIEIFPG